MRNWFAVSEVLDGLLVRTHACLTRDEGQGVTEYALILALIALVTVVALSLLGGQANDALSTVASSMQT